VDRFLADEAATERLGAVLALGCPAGAVVYLRGELGAGKTTLVRGYRGVVKSPTYTLVETYGLPAGTVYHWDLYRLRVPEELAEVGARDYFDGQASCLVEWPERAGEELPRADLDVLLSYSGQGRRARLEAASETGRDILRRLEQNDNQE
jgi:tRNA threonylcarbamoyladenosine biosynthesis protein TsaE